MLFLFVLLCVFVPFPTYLGPSIFPAGHQFLTVGLGPFECLFFGKQLKTEKMNYFVSWLIICYDFWLWFKIHCPVFFNWETTTQQHSQLKTKLTLSKSIPLLAFFWNGNGDGIRETLTLLHGGNSVTSVTRSALSSSKRSSFGSRFTIGISFFVL